MSTEKRSITKTFLALVAVLLMAGSLIGCAAGPLTTREKGALTGTGLGALAGGLVGAAVGHPGAGAAIGGGLGLGTGALVGDQLQAQENRSAYQERQIRRNQAETARQRREIEQLKQQQGEY